MSACLPLMLLCFITMRMHMRCGHHQPACLPCLPLACRWFVSMNYTDYHLVQEVYMKNHEIATHTLHHVADPDLFQVGRRAVVVRGVGDWGGE